LAEALIGTRRPDTNTKKLHDFRLFPYTKMDHRQCLANFSFTTDAPNLKSCWANRSATEPKSLRV
jgi:hypothetical protein